MPEDHRSPRPVAAAGTGGIMPHRIISRSAVVALLASVAAGALSISSGAMAFGQRGGGGHFGGGGMGGGHGGGFGGSGFGGGHVGGAHFGGSHMGASVEATLVGLTSAEAIWGAS